MTRPAPVFVITGQLSAGKSSLARALLAHFQYGLHVDVDGVREMIVSGRASPLAWTEETMRQFGLAVRASASLARVYAMAGFTVAIEGAIDPEEVEGALEAEGLRERLVGVVLRPRLSVALERNRARTHKPFDTAILENAMRQIDVDLARDAARPGWHAVDNSDEPLERTVERILLIGQ